MDDSVARLASARAILDATAVPEIVSVSASCFQSLRNQMAIERQALQKIRVCGSKRSGREPLRPVRFDDSIDHLIANIFGRSKKMR